MFRIFKIFVLLVVALSSAVADQDFFNNLPDPTKPPAYSNKSEPVKNESHSAPPLTLQSIIISAGKRSAVINGNYVNVGSRVENAIVRSIAAQSVVVESDGRSSVLRLFKNQGIKRQVN